MTLLNRRRLRGFVAAACFGVTASQAEAADVVFAPVAAPEHVYVGEAMPVAEDCPTCSGDPALRKPFFNGLMHGKLHTKTVRVPYLCPGACFGYFQTKWNRWEDVCGHYYQGVDGSDAPKPPIPALRQPGANRPPQPGTDAPNVRPMPMPMPNPNLPMGTPLPSPNAVPTPQPDAPIVSPATPPVTPPAVGNKFTP